MTDANGILSACTSFQFIVTLVIVFHCLSYIKSLSTSLQGRILDVVKALEDVKPLKLY